MKKYDSIQTLIEESFELRRLKNPSYSKRAFAKFLGISSGGLSKILAAKQGVSIEMANMICDKLGLSQNEKEIILCEVSSKYSRGKEKKSYYQRKLDELKKEKKTISDDEFSLISNWYHFAILKYISLNHVQKTEHIKIATALSLDLEIVDQAILRLQRLILLNIDENNTYASCQDYIATQTDIPSRAIKSYHEQIISKASLALYDKPVTEREYSANMIGIDKEDLSLIKERIRKFKRELINEFGKKKDANLYAFTLQLFELEK